MEYSFLQLLAYFYIYSFLGWVGEVIIISVREHRFCNRGFLNLPLCPSYGLIFDILLVLLSSYTSHYLFHFLVIFIVSSTITFFLGAMTKWIVGTSLWQYEDHNIFGGEKKGLLYSLLGAAMIMLVIYVIHPVIFMFVLLIPTWLLRIICLILMIFMIIDFLSIIWVVHKHKNQQLLYIQQQKQIGKTALSHHIYHTIWNRLNKAYPHMKQDSIVKQKDRFAEGICFDKLIWVFIISAFLGDIIETLFCRITAGVWMSRSSVIYGLFSIVWGFGAVILTVVLQHVSHKDDRYVFLFGFFLGGIYEYTCSVFTEYCFGTVFWDYSHLPFQIGGRTNLLFCFFWGVLAVIWIKMLYPLLSQWIEKIPPITGKIITWAIIVLMICDALISALAMVRYVERQNHQPVKYEVQRFIDVHYQDDFIEKVWPNMKISS